MPTPNIYRKFAAWLKPKRTYLWIATAGALIATYMTVLPVSLRKSLEIGDILSWLGALLFMYSWWLICIEAWFRDRQPGVIAKALRNKVPRVYPLAKTVIEWYASLFLSVWFLSGIFFVAAFAMGFKA